MTDNLISAEQARENAEKFNLTSNQVIAEIAQSIEANSKAGNTCLIMSFKKTAVSGHEMEVVLAALVKKGFRAARHDIQPKETETSIKIEW